MNYAFIDSQNLNLGVLELGWRLDFERFRIYLKEKYKVDKAFIFIGYLQKNQKLYRRLRSYGYKLIFKPTVRDSSGKAKGNVDAELVLQVMIEFNNFHQAIIVSGDGDFHCLVKYLLRHDKFLRLLAPNFNYCSSLLKRLLVNNKDILFLNEVKDKIKTPV